MHRPPRKGSVSETEDGSVPVLQQGYLLLQQRQLGGLKKSYPRYFFALRGHMLRYWDGPGKADNAALGAVSLLNCTAVKDGPSTFRNRGYGIELSQTGSNPSVILFAESIDEFQGWKALLSSVLLKHAQVPRSGPALASSTKSVIEGTLVVRDSLNGIAQKTWQKQYVKLFDARLEVSGKQSSSSPRSILKLTSDFYVGDSRLREHAFIVSDFEETYFFAAEDPIYAMFWKQTIAKVLRTLCAEEEKQGQERLDQYASDHRGAGAPKLSGRSLAPPPPPPQSSTGPRALAVGKLRPYNPPAGKQQRPFKPAPPPAAAKRPSGKGSAPPPPPKPSMPLKNRWPPPASNGSLGGAQREDSGQRLLRQQREKREQLERSREASALRTEKARREREEEERARRGREEEAAAERRRRAREAEERRRAESEAAAQKAARLEREARDRVAAARAEEERLQQQQRAAARRSAARREAAQLAQRANREREAAEARAAAEREERRAREAQAAALRARKERERAEAVARAEAKAREDERRREQLRREEAERQRRRREREEREEGERRRAEAERQAAEEQRRAAAARVAAASQQQNSSGGKLAGRVAHWNQASQAHSATQASNPFSGKGGRVDGGGGPKRGDAGYGTAAPGSKTAERAAKAKQWVEKEIDKLVAQIRKMGRKNSSGQIYTTFGELFLAYQDISDTLVGILMRAKKRKLLAYTGDMLFQGMHDKVEIVLLC